LIKYLQKNNIKQVYWENQNLKTNIEILEKINYSLIIKNIVFDNKKIIKAIYIKKPSIS
jgi:hypothetical protein